MLSNAYFAAKIGADTAENEQHFAEILPADDRPVGLSWPLPLALPRLGAGVLEVAGRLLRGLGCKEGCQG